MPAHSDDAKWIILADAETLHDRGLLANGVFWGVYVGNFVGVRSSHHSVTKPTPADGSSHAAASFMSCPDKADLPFARVTTYP